MSPISKIIVHAADTTPGMDIGAADIRRWHVEGNGWADIGYHYVIRRNGVLETGRDLDGDGEVLDETGAHVYGHNAGSIGICLVGGRSADGHPDCNFTAAQWAALEALVRYLTGRFPQAIVRGHRDFDAGKACPCFDVAAWWTEHRGSAA